MKQFSVLSVALWMLTFAVALSVTNAVIAAEDVIPPASQRFVSKDADEVPNFQQHVVPLLSRLGCNGRACHGSFQGQGGFRLSLFGYDFKLDHEGMTKGDAEKKKEPRVLIEEPEDSLTLLKATQETPHRGGKRMDVDSWQYNIFRNWIKAGAKTVAEDAPTFVRLDVTPREIQFAKNGEQTQLKAVAVWSNGTQEDVTPLCRFNSNDEVMASIDANGLVTAGDMGDTHVVVNYDAGVVPIPVIRPVSDKAGDKYPQIATATKVDELVVQKLRKLGIVPSELCEDHEFLRRASLDITGTLPAPQEVVAFLSDTDSNKRAKKIDELLERPGYAAWWATKLSDFTGNNANMLNRGNVIRGAAAAQAWYDWLFSRVANNTPYDELVAGIVAGKSRKDGESYEDYCQRMSGYFASKSETSYGDHPSLDFFWSRQNFLKSEDRAIGFAYTFMGMRIQCAQCHKHPFDQWTQNDFNQFKEFFNGTAMRTRPEDKDNLDAMLVSLGVDKKAKGNDLQKLLPAEMNKGKVVPFEELVVQKPQAPKANDKDRKKDKDKDNGKANARKPAGPSAKLLGGDVIYLTEYDDPRSPLMSWLREKNNRFFARAFVNRVWSNYFSVGIVNPADDMSLANAPSNAPLLDYLATEFVEHNFDMKWLHREICNSAAYQRSWHPNETNKLDQKNFSHAIPRRLPAEVAVDVIKQATLSDTEFANFTANLKGRAIFNAIPNQKNQGQGAGFAVTVFGRSTRESNCDCDRSMEASLLQTVYMQNDDDIVKLLGDGKGWVRSLTQVQSAKPARPERNDKEIANAKSVRRNFEKALEVNQRALKNARKAGKEGQVKEIEERIAELKAKIAKGQSVAEVKTDETPQPADIVRLEPDELIKSAYLRSLSRLPEAAEMETSKKFLAQSEDTATGARDLLWALMNTKEFIVNH